MSINKQTIYKLNTIAKKMANLGFGDYIKLKKEIFERYMSTHLKKSCKNE